METNVQPRKSLSSHLAWRGAVGGLLGYIAGRFAANYLLSLFNESPKWLAPVVVVGFVAVFVMAFLLLPLVLHRRAAGDQRVR